ncbi:uncharacterized protein LOC144876774 [Branchiostoma floridae x Branchiostoma japonicum]
METREVERWHTRYDKDAVRRAEDDLQRQHEDERERDRQRREREKEERDRRERQDLEARKQKELKDKMAKRLEGLEKYKVGSKKNMEQDVTKEGIKHVNIVMFGPSGSGKSSFIQIAEQILLGKTTALVQADSKEGTTILEKYLAGSELKFHLVDTRGFFHLKESMHRELNNILTGKIRPSQLIVREEDSGSLPPGQSMREGPVPLKDKMHAVICVLGQKDPKRDSDQMKNIRKMLKEEGYSPVGATAFLNEGDFTNKDKRESAMIKMSTVMGCPLDRTYAFVNHIAAKTPMFTESSINVLEVLETALISAEMYIKTQLQREAAVKVRAKSTADASSMSVRDFMSQIGEKHGWEEAKVNSAVQKLEDEDVYNVAGLKEFWDEVKSKLSLGMRSAVQNTLFPK